MTMNTLGSEGVLVPQLDIKLLTAMRTAVIHPPDCNSSDRSEPNDSDYFRSCFRTQDTSQRSGDKKDAWNEAEEE